MLLRKEDGTVNLDRITTINDFKDQVPDDLKKLVILLTGTNPGTGASTLKDILAKMLDLDPVEAGRIRRAIALDYSQFYFCHLERAQAADPNFKADFDPFEPKKLSPEIILFNKRVWRQFIAHYFDEECNLRPMSQINDQLQAVISGGGNLKADQNIRLFSIHQREYGLADVDEKFQRASRNFDLIPDLLAYQILTSDIPENKYGRIYEAKMAVLISAIASKNLPIDESATASDSLLNDGRKQVFQFQLDVSDRRSAERVLLREIRTKAITPPKKIKPKAVIEYLQHGQLPKSSTTAKLLTEWVETQVQHFITRNNLRMEDDYQRWSDLYGLPLSYEFMSAQIDEKHGAIIDTSHTTEEQTIKQVLETIAKVMPELSYVLLECLGKQLSSTNLDAA